MTAIDTLPNNSRSRRLRPLAPTKTQSASHLSASFNRSRFGSSTLIMAVVTRPAAFNCSTADSTISSAIGFSLATHSAAQLYDDLGQFVESHSADPLRTPD